jgi:hypothetical protein
MTEDREEAAASSSELVEEVDETAKRQIEAVVEAGKGERLLEVFEFHLAREITQDSWGDLKDAVTLLAGREAFVAITWIAYNGLDDAREAIEALDLKEREEDLLERLILRSGSRMREAQFKSDTPSGADDWESTRHEVSRDLKSGQYNVTFVVRKNNRERMTIRGSAHSMAQLARNLLFAVSEVDDTSAFGDDVAAALRRAIGKVEAVLPAETTDDP